MTWVVPGYTEIKSLGRGASGRVVLAQHNGTGQHVAIKYLADHLAREPEFVSAFRTEARILSEVENPQIARLYEYLEAPEGAAIVMELVDGVALRAMLKEHGPTEPQSALVVLKGSLLGLAAAHTSGIVHRDYKPENVLVDQTGQSKLADFGIAARTGLQGVHAGTPSYMAPEQWAGAPATPSTDIYAATATFFECLTGKPPFQAPGDLLGLRKQHEQAPIPVDLVPEQVRGLVRRGLAKKSEHRPKDAATFVRELDAVAGAGYGENWEEEGRASLAKRAALLLLLFPIAGAAAGGTGVGKTILGLSQKAFTNALLIAGAAIVLLAGVGGYAVLADNQTSPPAPLPLITSPSSTPSVSPSPSPSPSPSESPSPSPSVSPSKSPSKKPPSSPPPPPTPKVSSLTVSNFCWLDTTKCELYYKSSKIRAHISIGSNTGQAITLRLRFIKTYVDGGEHEFGTPIMVDVVVPAGAANREYDVTPAPDMGRLGCGGQHIKLTVQVIGIEGPTSAPQRIDKMTGCPTVIR